jgi:hypothetical protein
MTTQATSATSHSRRNSQPDSFTIAGAAAVAAGPVLHPAGAQPGQSLLLFPQQPRAHGTPCEVANMLRLRCQALGTLQAGEQRLEAFGLLIMQINDVRDDERGSVIHLLLSQIPSLPEASRADALRDTAILAGGAAVEEQAGLCAQVARTVAALPSDERPAALRSALLRAGSLALDRRALPLPALASALSALHDANAQQSLLGMLCGLVDRAPAEGRLIALEQLAAVSWLTDTARLSAHTATLQRLQAWDDPACSTTLARLATDLPKLPQPSRLDAFHGLLKRCASMPDGERPALLNLLDDAVASLPDALQVAAHNALSDAGLMPKPASADSARTGGTAPARGEGYIWFTSALAAACKRSPANRMEALEELANELGALPEHQRGPALYAWLNAGRHPLPAARVLLLSRIAREIGVLPAHLRQSAWSKLRSATDQLPACHRDQPLAELGYQISNLPEAARLQALQSLMADSARLSPPVNATPQAMADAIGCLPAQQRFEVFRQLGGMMASMPGLLGPLADSLPFLPVDHRGAGFHVLANHCNPAAYATCSVLAHALATLPEPALGQAAMALLDAASPYPQNLTVIAHGLERSNVALPVMTLGAFLNAASLHRVTYDQDQPNRVGKWLKLMDAARPLFLRQPEAHWTQLANGRSSHLPFISVCRIASSDQSLQQKGAALSSMMHPLLKNQDDLPLLPDDLLQSVLRNGWATLAATGYNAAHKLHLLMRSSMSDSARAGILAGLAADPANGQMPELTRLAMHAANEPMLSTILQWALNSDLAPAAIVNLLTGHAHSAGEQSICKSNALLTALHNSNAAFVDVYAMHIAASTLPDKCKLALLGGRHADAGKEKEIKACMKAADAATLEAFTRQVSMSSLRPPLKEELLRYC